MNDDKKKWYSVRDEGVSSEINGMFFETWLKSRGFKNIRSYSNRRVVFISIETREYSFGTHYPVPVFATVNRGRCLTSQEFKEIYDMVMAGMEPVLPEEIQGKKENTNEQKPKDLS